MENLIKASLVLIHGRDVDAIQMDRSDDLTEWHSDPYGDWYTHLCSQGDDWVIEHHYSERGQTPAFDPP
ncbi:MAG: hypothetical protein HN396_15275 [Gemmatimonadales bacterium]|jgi:hypothetical protein|nr:hypothetical protein [Gemmatimonadales bacterium]